MGLTVPRHACYGRGPLASQFASISRRPLLLARRVSLAATAGAIALLVVGSPLGSDKVLADQFTQQIQTLSAQAGALTNAIASLSAASSSALGRALASEVGDRNTQGRLAQAQPALDQANKNLAEHERTVADRPRRIHRRPGESRADPRARLRAHRRRVGHRDSGGQQEFHGRDGCAHERRPGECSRPATGHADSGEARSSWTPCRNSRSTISKARTRSSTACRRSRVSSTARRSHTASRRHR